MDLLRCTVCTVDSEMTIKQRVAFHALIKRKDMHSTLLLIAIYLLMVTIKC